MGEKNNNGGEQKKKEGDNKKKDEKKNVTVVLKADLHCDGCATKFIKCIRSFSGVETAMIEDGKKITVVGNVDPVKLREKVEKKTHKKVELISPLPKKDGSDNKENAEGGKQENKKKEKESKDKNAKDKKPDEKKSKEKEPPVTTAVLKVHLHCEGCIQKIYKTVTKTNGYQEIKFDKQKDTVTVTGSMDMKALAELLQKQLKKNVEIVPPKKDDAKKEKGDGGDKGKKAGGESGSSGGGGDEKMEGNKMQAQVANPYPYPFMYGPGVEQFNYNPYNAGPYHAPQIFSDENPNACSVM